MPEIPAITPSSRSTINDDDKSVAAALQSTLRDVQIRGIVQDVMSDLLIDVELSCHLNRDLQNVSQQHALQRRAEASEQILEETRALEQQRSVEHSQLADTLVKELWNLSKDLGDLIRWKHQHEHLIVQHDETVAKLLQAEMRIQAMEEAGVEAVIRGDDDEIDRSLVEREEDRHKEDNSGETQKPPAIEKKTVQTKDDSSGESHTHEPSTEPTSLPEADSEAPEPATAEEEESVPQTPVDETQAVVSLIEEEPPPALDTIDMSALTHVFSFLDALEILSTAQVNVSMYSRVDALFGFSDVLEGDVEEPEVASESAQSAESQPVAAAPLSDSGTLAQPPAESLKPAAADPSKPAPPIKSASIESRPTGGIFSLLQARANRAPRAKLPARQAPTGGTSQPLSAAMADSMAAKLTDTELGAIISMKENLHKREKEVQELSKEKEVLAGRLEGTEALKDFLLQKVKDVEKSLSKRREDDSKVTQQIASDQEVIAFLDGRVQELERDIRALTEERKSVVEDLSRVKTQNSKKITVLSDMLQFERERVSENEREWKATKKLLVKEIKSCRAQLVALQAERDGFREQNEKLKRAIVSTNTSNGSMRD